MRGKPSHRVPRICTGRRPAGTLSELHRSRHALLIVHWLQRCCAPGVRLRCTDYLSRYCRLPANGAGRGTRHRILSAGRCAGTRRLPGELPSEHGKTAQDGGAEFLRGPAHDHAQCSAEVHTAFRAAAARADLALRLPLPPAAALDPFEVSAVALDDAEFAGVGTPFHDGSCSLERSCRARAI